MDDDKLTVVIPLGEYDDHWEYRCGGCGQLRLGAHGVKPIECGNCGSTDLTVGKVGSLPT